MTADLLTLAQNLARRAGTQARIGRSQGMHVVGTKLTDTDMVTKFDREAEAMIIAGLRAARPDDSIVGEEGGGHRGTGRAHGSAAARAETNAIRARAAPPQPPPTCHAALTSVVEEVSSRRS